MSISSNQLLVQELLNVGRKVDKITKSFDKDIKRIENKYSPRSEFERWRDSDIGKNWKAQQYQLQRQCCAECRLAIPLKGSHIDHIQPISKYPALHLTLKNLRITCPECNLVKGAKLSYSPQIIHQMA